MWLSTGHSSQIILSLAVCLTSTISVFGKTSAYPTSTIAISEPRAKMMPSQIRDTTYTRLSSYRVRQQSSTTIPTTHSMRQAYPVIAVPKVSYRQSSDLDSTYSTLRPTPQSSLNDLISKKSSSTLQPSSTNTTRSHVPSPTSTVEQLPTKSSKPEIKHDEPIPFN
ncbi:hypothetical protein K7432_006586, partial [Basidiobolus ranarum]